MRIFDVTCIRDGVKKELTIKADHYRILEAKSGYIHSLVLQL